MIVYDFSFVLKAVKEALIKAGYFENSFEIEIDDNVPPIASFVLDRKTLFIVQIQSSLVDESPTNIRLVKMHIQISVLMTVANTLSEIFGDRAKIILG